MPLDSVERSSIKKRPSSNNPVANLVKITTLGVLGFGTIIANSLLPVTPGTDIHRDTIVTLAGIETTANCTETGCVQSIIGITEGFILYNSSGSFVIGDPADPICELSESGALQGTDCTISSGVDISGVPTFSDSESRYVNASGDTMTGTLIVPRVNVTTTLNSSGSLTAEGLPRIQRIIAFPLCDGASACATGSGVAFRIPTMMDSFILSGATLDAAQAGTTGTMTVQVWNDTDQVNLFTTKISLDSTEESSDTAAAVYVMNSAGNITVTSGDRLVVRTDAVHTTPAKGVTLNLWFIPQ